MRYSEIKFDHLLERVEKPGRYTGHELNISGRKPADNITSFCLAYPDVYEVGFSHLGLKILYHILNEEEDAMADRTFAPWGDMGALMENEDLPLWALESKAAVKDFDVLGFTLQSELTYTNILYMLKLSGISIRRQERREDEPVILAGGPCGSNPEPLTDFIDAFLIGDGEEAILEIKDVLQQNRDGSRKQRLQKLSEIKGVYVPGIYDTKQGKITARKFMDFDNPHYQANRQIVPWLQPTHDRYVSEIMRGCSRGCRFCHAGYFYRPVREKSPELIKQQIMEETGKQGWEEVALTSLSSSDYTRIRELLTQITQLTAKNETRLSLPSLRVDSLDETLTGLMNEMQQKSITIAPEAGSQRLRDIINKNFSEEDILEGVRVALQNGWRVIKLYFMIGLPFEEKEDIEAIAELVEKITKVAGRRLQINITVSPFVPKPFTPFQWSASASPDELMAKVRYLKQRLFRYKFIKLKYHTIEYQALETVLGRGDSRVGALIEAAYKRGAMFDGWDEYFDYSKWQQAEIDSGIKIADYSRGIELTKKLPWDHISIGVSNRYFREEYEKAEHGEVTEDCREGCTACGLCGDIIRPVYKNEIEPVGEREIQDTDGEVVSWRVFYKKGIEVRYIGHLDMLRMTYRLVRASGLPLVYSAGYNRHPQVSFGPPLPLGMISDCEYFDFKTTNTKLDCDTVKVQLQQVFPPGMEVVEVISPVTKAMRSMEYYSEEQVELLLMDGNIRQYQEIIDKYNKESEWQIERKRKNKVKLVDLKKLIRSMEIKDNQLHIRKKVSGASIYDIMEHLFGVPRTETTAMQIRRRKLFR